LIVSVFFYKRLSTFYKNSPYFFDMVKKLLGLVLLIFAFSLFYRVIVISKYSQGGTSPTDKIMRPEKLPLFISFDSASCEDCQIMKPVVEKLKKACGARTVDFRAVDMEDSQYEYLIYQQGIFGSPTYILIDNNGQEKQRLLGIQKLEDLNKDLKILTGYSCLGQ